MKNFYDYFRESHSIEPAGIYCSVTGKNLGTLSPDELDDFLDSYPDVDVEDLADDWIVRLIASMRPSPNWNVMREETLDSMRQRHPIETFAYCINRLTSPHDFVAVPLSQRTSQMLDRIANYAEAKALFDSDHGAFDRMLHMLIEIDSKNDLAKQPEPFAAIQWREGDPESKLEMVIAWYTAQCKLHEERVELAKRTANWVKHGNPLMSHAASKLMREIKPSKTRQKQEAKRKESEFFDNLLSEVMSGAATDSTTITPERKAQIVPKKSGLKLRLNMGARK